MFVHHFVFSILISGELSVVNNFLRSRMSQFQNGRKWYLIQVSSLNP